MIKRAAQKAINWHKWWSYKRKLRGRLELWDSKGGGIHASEQIEPFTLLMRPSFNPIALDDPIYQDSHYQANLPAQEKQVHREYVYHVRRPCYIEPEFGYVIMEPAVLIPESLALSYYIRMSHKLHYFSGIPSLTDYEGARNGKNPVQQEPIVVSLRHVFDTNYAHCLLQLMTALLLLNECGVSLEIPIVVSSQLGRMPFFQEIIQRGELKHRRWIVQEAAYIHAQEVIFAATEWPSRALLNGFLDAIEVPQGNPGDQKRLFILRRSRQLSNMDALLPALDSLGFDPIRTEEMTFAQQIALFAQASVVCGVLGAGLTNMIFRRDAPVTILEVQAFTEQDVFFYGLARTCGYAHHHFTGSPYETKDRYSNFSVEPERFQAFLSDAVGSL